MTRRLTQKAEANMSYELVNINREYRRVKRESKESLHSLLNRDFPNLLVTHNVCEYRLLTA